MTERASRPAVSESPTEKESGESKKNQQNSGPSVGGESDRDCCHYGTGEPCVYPRCVERR